MKQIADDEYQPIVESGTIFEWMPVNTISDNVKDMGNINSAMDDAKYYDSSEEKNKQLYDHINYNGNEWGYGRFLKLDYTLQNVGNHNRLLSSR